MEKPSYDNLSIYLELDDLQNILKSVAIQNSDAAQKEFIEELENFLSDTPECLWYIPALEYAMNEVSVEIQKKELKANIDILRKYFLAIKDNPLLVESMMKYSLEYNYREAGGIEYFLRDQNGKYWSLYEFVLNKLGIKSNKVIKAAFSKGKVSQKTYSTFLNLTKSVYFYTLARKCYAFSNKKDELYALALLILSPLEDDDSRYNFRENGLGDSLFSVIRDIMIIYRSYVDPNDPDFEEDFFKDYSVNWQKVAEQIISSESYDFSCTEFHRNDQLTIDLSSSEILKIVRSVVRRKSSVAQKQFIEKLDEFVKETPSCLWYLPAVELAMGIIRYENSDEHIGDLEILREYFRDSKNDPQLVEIIKKYSLEFDYREFGRGFGVIEYFLRDEDGKDWGLYQFVLNELGKTSDEVIKAARSQDKDSQILYNTFLNLTKSVYLFTIARRGYSFFMMCDEFYDLAILLLSPLEDEASRDFFRDSGLDDSLHSIIRDIMIVFEAYVDPNAPDFRADYFKDYPVNWEEVAEDIIVSEKFDFYCTKILRED